VEHFDEYIEQLEYLSENHEKIIEYINDVHTIDDFEYLKEFFDRYEEIEQMINQKEIY